MSPLPVVCTGIKVMVTMKHLKAEQNSRDNSSCESDIDRQELIDNYGSENYLSKWNVDVDDDDSTSKDGLHEQDDVYKQSSEKPLAAREPHCLATEDDAASLVSYNSVRDVDTPVKRETSTASYLPYQIQSSTQQLTLWQGYSGNIYFVPVRCQSMKINTSKPCKQKPKDIKKCRKTKSCSPSMELANNHYNLSSANSFHSLGSLRFASRDEKAKKATTISQNGKLCKGFIDSKNSLTGHHHHRHHIRCVSAPESLVISAGLLKDVTADPVDHVFKHNLKTRLVSKSKGSFPNIVIGSGRESERGRDKLDNPSEALTNLPLVETVVSSREVTEPKPVFIIPFGALDDPVEGHNKTSVVGETSKRNSNGKKWKVKDAVPSNEGGVKEESRSEAETGLSIIIPTAEKNKLDQQSSMRRVGMAGNDDVDEMKAKRNSIVRREISDSSLSNYLQAVPTHLSKNISSQQKKIVPKLSYTKRTRDNIPGQSLSMDSMLDARTGDIRITSTTALYGGYLPSTRVTDTQLFRSEPSLTGESDSLRSNDEQWRVSNPKRLVKRNSNKSITSKHSQDTDKCHLPVIGWHLS